MDQAILTRSHSPKLAPGSPAQPDLTSDAQAVEEPLLAEDEDAAPTFGVSVTSTSSLLITEPFAKPPPLPGDLALSDPQIPSDVIIVDVAVDNHTQGILIEDGPCAGIPLASIQPYIPPRIFLAPRKPAAEDEASRVAVVPEKPRNGFDVRDRPAQGMGYADRPGVGVGAGVGTAAATMRLQPPPQQPATNSGHQTRAHMERRHTLPANAHPPHTPKQTLSAPVRTPTSATAAPQGRPPPREREPLPVVRRPPRAAGIAAAAAVAATAAALAMPLTEIPESPVASTATPTTPAPAGRSRRQSEVGGSPPAFASVPAPPSSAARRATEPSLSFVPAALGQQHPALEVKTEGLEVPHALLSSPLVTSPMLVSPLEAPVQPPRKAGRPPKIKPAAPVVRYSTRSGGTNPLPTPDATRPATPLADEQQHQQQQHSQPSTPDIETATRTRRPGRPKSSSLADVYSPVDFGQGSPVPQLPATERKPFGRPRKRVESAEEAAAREAAERDAVAAREAEHEASLSQDPRALRRAERAKANEQFVVAPSSKTSTKIIIRRVPIPGTENSSAAQNAAVPMTVPPVAPVAEQASGDEGERQRKRAASPSREQEPPSPKRLKTPEMEEQQQQQQQQGEQEQQPEEQPQNGVVDIHLEQAPERDIASDSEIGEEIREEEDTGPAPMEVDDEEVPETVPSSPLSEHIEEQQPSSPEPEPQLEQHMEHEPLKDASSEDDLTKMIVYRKETDATLVDAEYAAAHAHEVPLEQYRTPESLTDGCEDTDKIHRLEAKEVPVQQQPAQQPKQQQSSELSNDEDGSQPDSEKTVATKGLGEDSDWVQVTPILSDTHDDRSSDNGSERVAEESNHSSSSSTTHGNGTGNSDKNSVAAPVTVSSKRVVAVSKLPLVNYASDEDDSDSDMNDEDPVVPAPVSMRTATAAPRPSASNNRKEVGKVVVEQDELERLLFADVPSTNRNTSTATANNKGGSETEEDILSDDSELDPALNSISGKPSVTAVRMRSSKSAVVAPIRYDEDDQDELVL